MITNDGVELISKYLVGQASSYAAYIAVGSGARQASNNQPITVIASGVTVGTVTGGPSPDPYTATLTLSAGYWSYLQVGDIITATQTGTGSLGSGTVTVSAINSAQQIVIESTATMTAGAGLTNVKVYSSPNSDSFSFKKNLDFEVARFPISSRSYVVEKQTSNGTALSITGEYEITVTVPYGHVFVIGDSVLISDVDVPPAVVGGPANGGVEVNGLYKITSTTSTSFVAQVYDTASAFIWDSSVWNVAYFGFYYNADLFNITVFTKQISLTAEMSDTSKYDISEMGLYSLGSNQYSGSGNSKMLLSFEGNEGWQHYSNSGTSFSDVQTLSPVVLPIGTDPKFCSSSDAYWNGSDVKLRQEKPRILEQGLIVPGALSNFTSGTTFDSASDYLLLQDPGINLSKSSGTDEIRLAYSIMKAVNLPSASPNAVYIMFEFVCSNGTDSAKLLFSDVPGGTIIYPNRYNVLTNTMSGITTTSGFDWSKVNSVKVYCAIEATGTPTDDYAVVLDGLRFENVGTENPLYALTAYTLVNNATATTISKKSNSNDLINFRLDFSVGA